MKHPHHKKRRWIGIICLFVVLLVASRELCARQASGIYGVVFDQKNGETIPLVNIIKIGTTIGTNSTENGSYSLNLSPGIHDIRFSSLAYKDTVISISLKEGERRVIDVYLKEDQLLLDEIVVSADRVTRLVQNLAAIREERNAGLTSYSAEIYKLAILSTINHSDSSANELNPMAFSERYSRIQHILHPERYTETLLANRSSKNFFSEYDFFSTGGPPLNLNQELIPLSILSEDITIVGPISQRAGRFYYLDEKEVGDGWPEGTSEITVSPKVNNRPLFKGSIWYNRESLEVLGVNLTLNDYASTNTGLFSISNLRYQQTYTQVQGYWLPKQTKLSATLKFMTSANPIIYNDEWTWSNHRVNPPDLKAEELDLNTRTLLPDSHRKEYAFWDNLPAKKDNENLKYLPEAQQYTERNRTLRLGMSLMSNFFRLPYQLEQFYLTNISDIYHFNRVEGHTLGLGLRTPVHPGYEYRAIAQYGFSSKAWTYRLSGYHFIPGTAFAPEFITQKTVIQQYQDYEYNRTPLDFYEFRQTMTSLISGSSVNNYFLKEGWSGGIRFRFDIESFVRVLYLNETHTKLESSTEFNLLNKEIEPELYPNNDLEYPALDGELHGISLQLHHDTRKYLRTQFLRDYNIRDFGWLIDAKLEKGISKWGSSFDFNRYRIGLKFNVPVFSAHFIQTDVIVGASDGGTPGQRLFNFNGFVVDDYIRERPFNTATFKDPIGYRVSLIKVKYKFGSSITRKIPIGIIQKSGIQLATFLTAGSVDSTPDLTPLVPSGSSKNQVELGVAAFRIFGFIYVEFSRRLIGEYGNSVGVQMLF